MTPSWVLIFFRWSTSLRNLSVRNGGPDFHFLHSRKKSQPGNPPKISIGAPAHDDDGLGDGIEVNDLDTDPADGDSDERGGVREPDFVEGICG